MSDQAETTNTGDPRTKAELLDCIRQAWEALEAVLPLTNEVQMRKPGPGGWAIKDHLAHLAVWELGLVALLRREPRFEAMRIAEAVEQGKSEEEVNDLIFEQHAGLTPQEAVKYFREVRHELLQALDGLEDADLQRPYRDYLPPGESGPDMPVMNWILGNTCYHYDEHRGYILALLGESG